MKKLLLLICIWISAMAQAQVMVNIESTYVNDGALGMVVTLANPETAEMVLGISDTKSLRQLAFPLREHRLDSLLQSEVPVTFVVFYTNDGMIDEAVAVCDLQLPRIMEIAIPAGATYRLNYESRCFSKSVIRLLNNNRSVKAEIYVLYRLGNKTYAGRSPMTRIKVKKAGKK